MNAEIEDLRKFTNGMLSRPVLSRLFQLKSVAGKGKNVEQFEELLLTEFESKWEALRKQRGVAQKSLFDPGPGDGLNLSTS